MVVFISIILVGIPSMIQADLKLWSRDSTFQDFLHRCVPHNSVCRIRNFSQHLGWLFVSSKREERNRPRGIEEWKRQDPRGPGSSRGSRI
ncbi:putative beta-xylosidase [Fusarium oxysporum f. sp. albedinis]|nr:putative beta-xylosidase [Fusarium oxysporum f. sp. albedinis]